MQVVIFTNLNRKNYIKRYQENKMTNTTIAVSTSLDVIDRYRELVEASLDGDSIYIRAKETVERLYENSDMTDAKNAELIASTIDNNLTIIDGGKIVTNEVFVNNLNAIVGIISEIMSANEIVGKTLSGSIINCATINEWQQYIKCPQLMAGLEI